MDDVSFYDNPKMPEGKDGTLAPAGSGRSKKTPIDTAKEQAMFLKRWAAKMDENGHSIEELAHEIDVPYSYIIAIKNGLRRIVKAEESTVKKFATYLDVPLIQIYIWGGFFKPVDFITKRTLKDGINQAFDRMQNDPMMTTITPSAEDWHDEKKWSEEAQLTVVRLYEIVSNELFLKHASLGIDDEAAEKLFLNYIKRY